MFEGFFYTDTSLTREQLAKRKKLRIAWTKHYKLMGLSIKKINAKIEMRISKGKFPNKILVK
jgi:hypothetical protein